MRKRHRHRRKLILLGIAIVLAIFAAGCKKKAPVASAPPPPKPAAEEPAKPNPPVIAEFATEPERVERGQSAVLKWRVTDATDIEINQGIGTVNASGNRQIKPEDSTTYTLVAKGPGGSATAHTTLSVILPPPPATPPAAPVGPTISDRLSKDVQDAFFNYDRSDLREDARTVLTQDAKALQTILKDFPNMTIVIEGHCDERGSAEYNLGLGDRRATSAKDFLIQIGIPADRLMKVSYGKERPQCTESNEACWQKNRRIHFAPGENQATRAGEEE